MLFSRYEFLPAILLALAYCRPRYRGSHALVVFIFGFHFMLEVWYVPNAALDEY
jgi:hypothetical protein